MNPSCSPPPEGHIKLNSATEIMILSLLRVILKSAAADGWFVRCVAGCRLGACPRPLGDLLFRCTRLVPLPRVALAFARMPALRARARHRACAA